MTSCTGRAHVEDFGDFEKVSLLDTEREGLTFACSPRPWAGVVRGGWVQMEKPE